MTPHRSAALLPSAPSTVVAERFVLEARLGRGRFGHIYQALDKHVFDESGQSARVALQLVRGEIQSDPRLRERFRQGFRRIQSWSHPNIVKLFELGCGDEMLLLTMELLRGSSLRFVLDDASPDTPELEETLALVREVGNALRFAHARGMTHGDIRPENVFVTVDYRVKVLDFVPMPMPTADSFSLAVRPGAARAENTSDVREDVYGLACLTYELLSGEHPYGGSLCEEARDAALVPRRIERLRSEQWTALQRGLALTVQQRTPTVAGFLSGLGITGAERLVVDRRPTGRGVDRAMVLEGYSAARRQASATESVGDGLDAVPAMLVPQPPRAQGKRSRPTSAVLSVLVAALGLGGALFAYHSSWSWHSIVQTLAGDRRQPPIRASVVHGTDSARPDQHNGAMHRTPGETRQAAAPSVKTPPAAPDKAPAVTTSEPQPRPSRAASLTVAAKVVTVSEAAPAAAIVVHRKGNASGNMAFLWWTSDGTALAGADYGNIGRRVETLTDGQRERTIYIPIVHDSVPERDEFFYVHIRPLRDARDPPQPSMRVKVVVIDDD